MLCLGLVVLGALLWIGVAWFAGFVDCVGMLIVLVLYFFVLDFMDWCVRFVWVKFGFVGVMFRWFLPDLVVCAA